GDVLLSRSRTGVFGSEGFPLELARKLRDRIMSAQSDAPLQIAGTTGNKGPEAYGGDPVLELAQLMSSAGMMKAGLIRHSMENGGKAGAPARLSTGLGAQRYTFSGALSGH